jgi:transposase
MRRRYDVSDEVWAMISPLLPAERGRKARPCRDNREMVNAMLWILRTGAPWRDLPSHFPPWKSVHTRFSRWAAQGIWQRALLEMTKFADTDGFMIDGTIMKAHQDAHGAQKKVARSRSAARAVVPPAKSMQSSMPRGAQSASR